MELPLISVVTCTKDTEKYLEKCLNSVEKQTYRNIEHVFIDGYSSDKSVEIIKKYILRNPKVKCVFKQSEAKGIANALNVALENCTGDVVHFLHSDDYYKDPQSLERVANYFGDKSNPSWLIGNPILVINEKEIEIPIYRILHNHCKSIISSYTIVQHENVFASKDFYLKYGPFDECHKITIEYSIWLRALREVSPLIVDDSFTCFIVHQGSNSSQLKNKLRDLTEIIDTWKKTENIPFVGYYKDTETYKYISKLKDTISKLTDEFNS